MARSIHTTRRTLAELKKRKFAKPEDRAKALKKARAALQRKRRIKELVKVERGRDQLPRDGSAVETIPVEYRDQESPFIHHALSLRDTRELLSRLPQAAVEAISGIQFCLGRQYMLEENLDGTWECDPITGRPGSLLLSGVFSGSIFGTYFSHSGMIAVYAFVYDPAKVSLPKTVYETYLRIHAAKTFMHEIAHHHDYTQRIRRGRWLADRKENKENYAEKMEHRWSRDVIVPFFEENYKVQTREMLDWVELHGGIRLPLEFFLGDSRVTGRDGSTRLLLSTPCPFEKWTLDIATHKNLSESRIAFAWELHYADDYERCLQVLDTVLADSAGCLPAMECKADTLVHLEKYDEAMIIADWVLARDGSNRRAWKTRALVFEAWREWQALLETCRDWEYLDNTVKSRSLFLIHRAIAYCGLYRLTEMENALDAFLLLVKFKDAEAAAKHRQTRLRIIYRRAGKSLPDPPPKK